MIIRPVPSPQLQDVRYCTDTPFGKLASHVSHDGTRVQVEVTIPFGTKASVYVPRNMDLMASDPLSDASYRVFEVGPGHHILSVN